jgi:aminoglycoside 2'-N-acetyltransferase I
MSLTTAFTADLDAATLEAVHAMVHDAFEGDYDDLNWEHALGGMHVLATEGDDIVGHAAVVQRHLLHGGRALRCGYVESVATRADRRRRGIGDALMSEVGRLLRGAYDLGALGATDDGARLYARHRWSPWPGPLAAFTPEGVRPTPESEGAVWVLDIDVPLDREVVLACDWRDGDLW